MSSSSSVPQADIDKATTQLAELQAQTPNVLFFIARSKNQNIVVYEALKKDDRLDPAKPIDVYWLDIDPAYVAAARKKGIMSDKNGLNMIENKLAYGVSAESVPNKSDTYYCRLVALPERPVTLFIDSATGKNRATIAINGKQCNLVRIFVFAVDRTLLPPRVEHVDLVGQDPDTGAWVSERIVPK